MPDRPIRAHRILQMMGRQRQAYPPATFKASKRSAGLYFISKSAKRYVYWWVDGIYLEARLEDQAQCILVIIGATPEPDFLHQPCAR